MAGRPTSYTQEMADKIIELMNTHDEGIKKLTTELDWLPAMSTIYKWCIDNFAFSDRFYEARANQMDRLAYSLHEIAAEKDVYKDKEGIQKIDPASVGVTKNKIDAIKWTAERLKPMRWRAMQKDLEQKDTQIAALQDLVAQLTDKYKSDT